MAVPRKDRLSSIKVTIRAYNGVIFSGEAISVSSKNEKGPFDILPGHINFITMVKESLIVRKADKSEEVFEIKGEGILHVYLGEVFVFLGVSETPELT